jgi:tRNA threonylcarbamoyl adenosine modification protein YeaZ
MKLIIDTTDNQSVNLALQDNQGQLLSSSSTPAFRAQGERLLPALQTLLTEKNLTLADITSIEVANGSGTFSSLRIGVTTANALAYALGVPVTDQDGQSISHDGLQIVAPRYNAEANIGGPKTKKAVDK